MRISVLAAALITTALAGPVMAQTTIVEDPLHGFCVVGSTLCKDNGTTTTIATGSGFSGADWGFTISPGPSGPDPFVIILAIPTNENPATAPTITGTIGVTPVSLLTSNLGSWTGGNSQKNITDVSGVAGLLTGGVTPTNPYSNFAPSSKVSDPGFNGYTLYDTSLSSITLQDNSSANTPAGALADMDLSATLPLGTMIFAFLENNPDNNHAWAGTASSGVLWVNGTAGGPPPPPPPPPNAPEPSTIAVLGVGLLGLAFARKRRSP